MADVTTPILALGASMRLTRLVVTDDMPGNWIIKEPLDEVLYRHRQVAHSYDTDVCWAARYREALDCPFCVGLWIAFGVTASAAVWGRRRWWRLLAAALTLNEVAAHTGVRLGDTAD